MTDTTDVLVAAYQDIETATTSAARASAGAPEWASWLPRLLPAP